MISVIVPVYNVERYLHRCIDSILTQSYTDFELLLIDDGSPDGCGLICDEYAAKDSRVRVFHKENGGVSSARNLGLDNARGEWIAFIDSDDYVDVDYLKELIAIQKDTGSDLVSILRIACPANECVTLSRNQFGLLFTQYKFEKLCPPWGKLFNRNLVSQYNLRFNHQVRLGEDVMFVLSYLLNVSKITLISSNKYIYEIERPDSLTKVINSYEIELAGKREFDRIVKLLIQNFCLDDMAICELESSQKYYVERTLSSIIRLPKRSERLLKLKTFDFTLYHKYKKASSWKESIMLYLLRNRLFLFYDFLLNVKG